MEFYKGLWNALLNAQTHEWVKYLLVVLGIASVLVFILILIYVWVNAFSHTNYTMRYLVRSKYGVKEGILKKVGVVVYFSPESKNGLVNKIYYNNRILLERANMYTKSTLLTFVLSKWLLFPLTGIGFLFYGYQYLGSKVFDYSLMIALLPPLLFRLVLSAYISAIAEKFRYESYKMFKFLRNQLSAGVKMSSVVNELHTVVDEPTLKQRLLLLASHYSSTNDIDGALLHITTYYKTLEAKSLAISIKNALETGQVKNAFEEKEKKLFNMFINVIKKRTQIIMLRYVGIAFLMSLSIFILFAYPLFLDFMQARTLLYGN